MSTGFTILVSTFTNINGDSNSRVLSVYKQITTKKKVITTDYNHANKMYYEAGEANHQDQILLHVPSYKKNISFKRIWSHLIFAYKLRSYLNTLEEKPKAIYCTMPTSSSAYVCANYCKKNGVKFVIDVIDLWPDSLLPLVKGKALLKKLLYPWTYITRYAYQYADVIMGESVKYANEAKRFNNKAVVYPIYLGVDVNYIGKIKDQNCIVLSKPDNEIWIGYAGSLGMSYDFEVLLDAIKSIHGRYKYKLWFIGDGVRRDEISLYINENKLNAEITGFLPYEQLLGYLSYCDIAVNIFRKNTKVVYSYKFNDYVAMDCFVLNSLKGETADLVDEYQIGRNFNFSDHSLGDVLEDTLAHWQDYCKWNLNCKNFVEKKLNKAEIYSVVNDIFNK